MKQRVGFLGGRKLKSDMAIGTRENLKGRSTSVRRERKTQIMKHLSCLALGQSSAGFFLLRLSF